MTSLLDRAHRLAYKLGYPPARLWWWLTRASTSGASVALRVGTEILVIRESYRSGLGLPAGGRKAGESALETALREVEEEVGIVLSADDLVMLHVFAFKSSGRQIEDTLFEARLAAKPPVRVDGREVIEAEWMCCDAISTSETQPSLRDYLRHARGLEESS